MAMGYILDDETIGAEIVVGAGETFDSCFVGADGLCTDGT